MVIYICPDCNKEFNRKSNYDKHTLNKKNPCNKSNFIVPPKSTEPPPKSTKIPKILHQNPPKNDNLLLNDDLIDLLLKEPEPNGDNCVCIYCEKKFARTDSLQRHLNGRCKSKENCDELQKLKEDMKILLNNYQILLSEHKGDISHLLNSHIDKADNKNIENIENIENINNAKTINNIDNKTINSNNQVNKGVIMNNTVNVQVVQFGNEDIDKLNLMDAMKEYLKSTGGNIASNMLKYINLNKQYPENNNICITDLSREIVKIHNGTKFVYKKFKNVKDELFTKIMKNTRKIVDKYESNVNLKKSNDTKNKLKINDVSLKLIDGISAEDIVREEINKLEKEKRLIENKNIKNDILDIKNKKTVAENESSESEVEREFTFEERLRIEHLENKREGMQKKTFENIKEELYNNRILQ